MASLNGLGDKRFVHQHVPLALMNWGFCHYPTHPCHSMKCLLLFHQNLQHELGGVPPCGDLRDEVMLNDPIYACFRLSSLLPSTTEVLCDSSAHPSGFTGSRMPLCKVGFSPIHRTSLTRVYNVGNAVDAHKATISDYLPCWLHCL